MREFEVRTTRRCQLIPIDREVTEALRELGVGDGIALVFCPHTTAGVLIQENADPDVGRDLLGVLERFAPADGAYAHAEGNSDAHAKAVLVGASVQCIVRNGRPSLGTWQSIFFAEFDGPRTRTVRVEAVGR